MKIIFFSVLSFIPFVALTESEFKGELNVELKEKQEELVQRIVPIAPTESIIDFKYVKSLTGAFDNVNETETESALKMYLDAANFDSLFENFSERVHHAVKKRLDETLILK